MKRLHVREPGERVRVEREGGPGEQTRHPIARPREHESIPGECGERQPCKDQDVEHEDRRPSNPRERRAEQRRHDERLGECEGVVRGMEDVPLKQVGRIALQLMRHPRE
ncbi:MAG TPA: hypothetical protein VM733_13295, partial [Thermoanaerobaculia bacterium]|nr:hypothetical protein [Thermoanaerobaculia bacterium]